MLKIFKHLKSKEWTMIGIGLIFIVAQVWLDLKLPDYMAKITLLVQTEGSLIGDILLQGLYMLLCALGSLATAIIIGFLAAKIGSSFSQRLRSKMFDKVDSFSMSEINKFSTASLITRSTNDITQVQTFLTMGMQTIIKAPILAVWAVIKISGKGLEWSVATAVATVVILLMLAFIIIFVISKFKKMQLLTDNINKVTREHLTGLPVVHAYNAEGYQEKKFEDANKKLTDTQLFTSRRMAIIMPFMSFVMSGLSLSIYAIGAVLINSASLLERLSLFSNMVVFSSYAMQVIMAFMMIAMLFIFIPRSSVSAKRINEVLDTEPSIRNGTLIHGEDGKRGEMEFRNVSFRYPGAADCVLKNINFKVNQGETIAFIGSTGSGKSTLINLIPRFFDPSEGEIFIDGVNVREYRLESLYNKLGYVPQKAVMFSGTVASNVAFGECGNAKRDAEAVERAIRIAQGKLFVEKMKGEYGAEIARDGKNISGGQKQRLAIARAICRDPEIYIFDDSFSALDYKTDRALRTALKKETKGATSIIVAQRIGTIIDADKIIVLDEGKIVGIGKHKELLKNCKVYKEIAMSQLSEEELAV